jgi:hypothetical protein
VLQGLQKTSEPNRVDDVVMLLFEEMQTAKNNGHVMPLSVVFVERKVCHRSSLSATASAALWLFASHLACSALTASQCLALMFYVCL